MRASRLYEFEVITSPEWSNGMTESLDCPIHAFILVDMNNHRQKVLVRFSWPQIEAWGEFVSGLQGLFPTVCIGVGLFWKVATTRWLCGTFPFGCSDAAIYLLYIRKLLSATLVVIVHFAYAGFDLRCSTMWAA